MTRPIVYLPAGWRMLTNKSGGWRIGEILDWLNSRLEKISDTPGLDAQVLLAHVLDKPRSWVLAHPEIPLAEKKISALEALVARLEKGEPLPYLLGVWEFFGMEFYITPMVLIPRPETEMLVTRAISWLSDSGRQGQKLKVLDVGTGSGCIAISLAVNVADVIITATDISPAALKVAHRNAEKLGVADRISFIKSDIFPDPISSIQYSLILANLPYIPTDTLLRLPVSKHEPPLALDGGASGLVLISHLLKDAPRWLSDGGMLLIEIEASKGKETLSLASDAFPKDRIQLRKDLAGHDRMLEIQS